MYKKLVNILSIALIYCGAVFGAGFASGREIFTFFSRYKSAGIMSAIIVGFLFSFFGFIVLKHSKDKNLQNTEEYLKELFPDALAKFFGIITNSFLVLSFCIMITGCGALFFEQFGIMPAVGSLLSLTISFITIKNDVSGLKYFNLVATPIMIVGVIALCVFSADMPKIRMEYNLPAGIYGLLYISYNMVSAVAVLVSISKMAKNAREAAMGGIAGGIMIAVPLVLMTAVLSLYPELDNMPLPFFSLVSGAYPKLSIICAIILYFAMMTTAVSSGVSVLSGVSSKKSSKYAYSLCILAFIMSFIPFQTLVQTVYSAFGFIGIALIIGISIKILRK